jgi:hypothetical protein
MSLIREHFWAIYWLIVTFGVLGLCVGRDILIAFAEAGKKDGV